MSAEEGDGWRRLAIAGAGGRRSADAGEGWRRRAKAFRGLRRLAKACGGARRLAEAGAGWQRFAKACRGARNSLGAGEGWRRLAKTDGGGRREVEASEGWRRRAKSGGVWATVGGGGRRLSLSLSLRASSHRAFCPSPRTPLSSLVAGLASPCCIYRPPLSLSLLPHSRALRAFCRPFPSAFRRFVCVWSFSPRFRSLRACTAPSCSALERIASRLDVGELNPGSTAYRPREDPRSAPDRPQRGRTPTKVTGCGARGMDAMGSCDIGCGDPSAVPPA